MASVEDSKKRKNGSAYLPEKRAATSSDPRRTKLHVNEAKNLRGYGMVLVTYNDHEGRATVELHRLLAPYLEEVRVVTLSHRDSIAVFLALRQIFLLSTDAPKLLPCLNI
jgi:hypothetical protein